MTDEQELKFKRFSDDKQEQVRQLVAYTTLMGLTGKDLISIGNKLERNRRIAEEDKIWSMLESYNITPNGRYAGRDARKGYYDSFTIDHNNKKYQIDNMSWYNATVRNLKNKKQKTLPVKEYDEASVVRHNHYVVRIMMNIYNKDIDLDKI